METECRRAKEEMDGKEKAGDKLLRLMIALKGTI